MTREGAIGNLIHAIRWNDMPKKEALDMAIQALEQEPCFWEKCPYYEPDMMFDGKDEYDMGKCTYKQEPKTGHWIDIDGGVECDKCGKWYPHAPIAKNEIKFCSECGAKMIEPQESEVQE